VVHRIVEMRYRLCASPDYLVRMGTPVSPGALADHRCLSWRRADLGGAGGVWKLVHGGVDIAVPVRFRLAVSDMSCLREATLNGLGLAILPDLDVRADLEAGRLVEVLTGYEVPSGVLTLVRPPTPFVPAKLRVFMDFMTSSMRQRVRHAGRDGADLSDSQR
jgi:DNA-binding transcriptional LysR family regulator